MQPSAAPDAPADVLLEVRRARADGRYEATFTVYADRRVATMRRDDTAVRRAEAVVKPWWVDRVRSELDRTQFCSMRPGDAHPRRPEDPELRFRFAFPGASCEVTTSEGQLAYTSPGELWMVLHGVWMDVDFHPQTGGTASEPLQSSLADEPLPEPVALELRSDLPGRPLEVEEWIAIGASGRMRSVVRDGLELLQSDVPLRPERVQALAKAATDAKVCAMTSTTRAPGDHRRYRLTLALPGLACKVDLWDDELWFGTGALWDLLKVVMADARYAATRGRLARPPQRVMDSK